MTGSTYLPWRYWVQFFGVTMCIFVAQFPPTSSEITLPTYYTYKLRHSKTHPTLLEEPLITDEFNIKLYDPYTIKAASASFSSQPIYNSLEKPQSSIESTMPNRNKRKPSGLYNIIFGARRIQRSAQPQPQPQPSPDSDLDSETITKIRELIIKMKLWEAALLDHFQDRFDQNAMSLALDPMWAKVLQVRSVIQRLMLQLAETQAGELDMNRMKK